MVQSVFYILNIDQVVAILNSNLYEKISFFTGTMKPNGTVLGKQT